MNDKKIKWLRRCNRHRWIPVVIAALFCPLYILLTAACDAIVIGYVFAGLFFLSSLVVGSSGGIRLRNHFGKALSDQCDPYPLLEEVNDQLSYVKSPTDRTNLVIDRAVCLCNIGDPGTALAELEALNIDDPVVIPAVRHAYYHNLTICAIRCGQLEKAEVYYQKTTQQLDSIKGKAYDIAAQTMLLCTAGMLVARGNYDEAYQMLAPFSPANRMQQVYRSYRLGQIALAQNQPDHARIHLEFVVQNGNRLYITEEARQWLSTLS